MTKEYADITPKQAEKFLLKLYEKYEMSDEEYNMLASVIIMVRTVASVNKLFELNENLVHDFSEIVVKVCNTNLEVLQNITDKKTEDFYNSIKESWVKGNA